MLASLLAALSVALPGSASAQGAGDEQYRDPFAGQDPGSQQPQQPADPGAAASPAPAQSTQSPAPASATGSQATGELPRTGFQGIALMLASGWALLVGGAALRRIA